MSKQFFFDRFLSSVVMIFMAAAYLGGVRGGLSTSAALTTAAWVGFIAAAFFGSLMTEFAGRHRMTNPIALWTTFLMAMAPVGPAVFAQSVPQSPLVFASVLVIIFTVLTAAATAHLLERAIMGGQRGLWYIEYGLAPFAVFQAAALEVGGNDKSATIALGGYWFFHFFYKQMPRLLASVGIKPVRSDG